SELPPSGGAKTSTIPPPATPPRVISVPPAAMFPSPPTPRSAPAITSAAARTPPRPPAPMAPISTAKAKRTSSPQIEVGEAEIDLAPDDVVSDSNRPPTAKVPPPPASSSASKLDMGGEKRNEALVAALKKIMTLSKNGRGADAYQEYATLFSSAA